jgi:glucose-6-phosphate 1-dehydrogenase
MSIISDVISPQPSATVISAPHPAPASTTADRRAKPCTMVIFGITGDLARRKLVPSLYRLSRDGLLHPSMAIVGFGRRDWSDENFRAQVEADLKSFGGGVGELDPEAFRAFAARLHFCNGHMDRPEGMSALAGKLAEVDRLHGTAGNHLFYLSTPPEFYGPVATLLGRAGLAGGDRTGPGWCRIVIEKPFGRDLDSARALQQTIRAVFAEGDIYRIDHYLGKETVQNILVFRFGNIIFEPLWNRRYIKRVQITAAETLGVEERGQYYETAGALRDMVQSHLLQLFCLTAMEPPAMFESRSVQDEKLKVLESVRLPRAGTVGEMAVRGQYGPGVFKEQPAPGYRQEKGVAPDSRTETYAAVRLFVDNWRWQGVPFYLRTGKRLRRKTTDIMVEFHNPPMKMFEPCRLDDVSPNVLTWRIQPDEGVSLTVEAKPPGPDVCVGTVKLDFSYERAFGGPVREAYETLILDAIAGEKMLYARFDWVEAAWKLITPILKDWEASPEPPPTYPIGTWGPKEADALTAPDGVKWR